MLNSNRDYRYVWLPFTCISQHYYRLHTEIYCKLCVYNARFSIGHVTASLLFLFCLFSSHPFLRLQQLVMSGGRLGKYVPPLLHASLSMFPHPPIVQHLTLPPASLCAASWHDLHRGLLWNSLVHLRVHVCAQTICFAAGVSRTFTFTLIIQQE